MKILLGLLFFSGDKSCGGSGKNTIEGSNFIVCVCITVKRQRVKKMVLKNLTGKNTVATLARNNTLFINR